MKKNIFKENKAVTAYLIIGVIFALVGLLFGKGDELIFMIFVQYLILPVAAFVCAAASVKKGTVLGFISPVIFVLVACVVPFFVFGKTDIAFFLFALVPSALGFVAGFIAYAVSKMKKKA